MVAAMMALQVTLLSAATGSEESLKSVSEVYRANIERIRTWRGEIQITTESEYRRRDEEKNNPSTYQTIRSVEFVCDRTNNSVRSNCLCEKQSASGPDSKSANLNDIRLSCNSMVTKGAYYRLEYDAARDFGYWKGTSRTVPLKRVAVVQTEYEKKAPQALGSEIDPFYWYTHRGKDIGRTFDTYYSWIKDGKTTIGDVSVTREGDIVTLLIRSGSAHNRYSVNLAKGANLVAYEAKDGPDKDRESWKYDYEEVNGVWVPLRISFEIDEKDGSRFVRTLQWSRNEVNRPITDADFSLVKLGLRRGDQVQDRRTGQQYKIQGSEYPPGVNPLTPASVSTHSISRIVLFANVILVGLLGVALLFRRWKSASA